jgi:hypothetical protein
MSEREQRESITFLTESIFFSLSRLAIARRSLLLLLLLLLLFSRRAVALRDFSRSIGRRQRCITPGFHFRDRQCRVRDRYHSSLPFIRWNIRGLTQMYHKEQRLRFSEARKRDAINLY